MKITLIGPVYPYKGGIAHYTSLLCRSLQKEHDVQMISFKKQYPKLLFKNEQKDYQNDAFKINNTQYWINTLNPINWLRVADRINRISSDLVIFPWWHPYFAPCFSSLVKRIKGAKILFLCHNVFPHERFPADKGLVRRTLKRGDFFIVHSKRDAEDLLSIKQNAIIRTVTHPTYNVFKYQNLSQLHARESLGIEQAEKILLFFGFVREYKGLHYLIKALRAITNAVDGVKLLIVGDFGNDKSDYLDLIESEGVSGSIQIYDGYIADKDIEKYFAASDLVVLPYVSATQSGIVQIAYGFEKPVIVTDVGGLPEVVIDGETGYVVPPQNPEEISAAVIRFFKDANQEVLIAGIKKEAKKYEWERMVETIDSFSL